MASKVENRIALTLPVFNFDKLTLATPTLSLNSFNEVGKASMNNSFTDLETGEMVDSTYEPTGDMTLYAKWNNFPYVFRQDGACTFGGSDGTITGADCSDYVGRKYIDTGVNLYNTTNHDKDY